MGRGDEARMRATPAGARGGVALPFSDLRFPAFMLTLPAWGDLERPRVLLATASIGCVAQVQSRPERRRLVADDFELQGESGARITCAFAATDLPGWLSGYAELRVPGFTGSVEIEGGADALAAFQAQLQELDTRLLGRAELLFEVGLQIMVVGDRGSVVVSGSASRSDGELTNRLDFSFHSDQTFLHAAVHGLGTTFGSSARIGSNGLE